MFAAMVMRNLLDRIFALYRNFFIRTSLFALFRNLITKNLIIRLIHCL